MSDASPANLTDPSDIVVDDPASEACGLIMPIAEFDGYSAEHWKEVRQILTASVESIDKPRFAARMVSDAEAVGTIHSRIVHNVYSNPIVVCDVSGRNPNVLFELGMRIAFDRPVVIVKDDATAFSFDISPLEHIPYPRSLRHGAIEQFKADLAKKVQATFQDWQRPAGRPSYIQSFGPITTVRFEERTEAPDKVMMEMLQSMNSRLEVLTKNVGYSPRSADIGETIANLYPWESSRGNSSLTQADGTRSLQMLSLDQRQRLHELVRERLSSGRQLSRSWLFNKLTAEMPDIPDAILRGVVEETYARPGRSA